jgi:hypothetical protein
MDVVLEGLRLYRTTKEVLSAGAAKLRKDLPSATSDVALPRSYEMHIYQITLPCLDREGAIRYKTGRHAAPSPKSS